MEENLNQKGLRLKGCSEIGKYLGISKRTAERHCHSGEIPNYRLGGQYFAFTGDLDRLIQESYKTKEK